MHLLLDTPVVLEIDSANAALPMALHESLLVAGYRILARTPMRIKTAKGDELAAFDGETVTGDAYFISVLRAHTGLVEKLLRDVTLELPQA